MILSFPARLTALAQELPDAPAVTCNGVEPLRDEAGNVRGSTLRAARI